MTIGIHNYRDPHQVDRLPGMLALPFTGRISGYAINRSEWRNGHVEVANTPLPTENQQERSDEHTHHIE